MPVNSQNFGLISWIAHLGVWWKQKNEGVTDIRGRVS